MESNAEAKTEKRGFFMLSGLFNYDNPVWRFIGKFWDVLILNVLWLVCSIPIVTIGASTTAMYYVTLKLARDEDGYTIRSFFKSFKENFRQATVIWLIFLAVVFLLGFDLYFFVAGLTEPSTFRTVMTTVFLAFLFVWAGMFTFVCPLQARFYNPVKKTIFNAFFMSIRHIFHTIGMIVIDLALIFFFFSYLPQLMVFGVALIAFVNSYFLNAIFKRYIPAPDRDIHDMRPIFAEEDAKEAAGQEAAAAGAGEAPASQEEAPAEGTGQSEDAR